MPRKPTGRSPGRPKPEVPAKPGIKPKLPDRLWKAIEVEVACYDLETVDWPSTATPGQVASAAGCTRRAIRQRRKDPLYRAAFDWRLRQVLLKELSAGLEAADAAEDDARQASRPPKGRLPNGQAIIKSWWSDQTRQRWARMDDAERGRWIERWVRRHWEGPVTSMLDGEVYATWETYAAHLLSAGALPAPDPLDGI